MSDLTTLLTSLRSLRVVDLSHALEEHMPNFPTHAKFFHNAWDSYQLGGRSLSYQLVVHEHNGTHVDAPAHFLDNAKPEAYVTIDRVPVNQLVGRGIRIDCRTIKAGGYATRKHIEDWERQHQAVEAGDIVLFDFGWAEHWAPRPHAEQYLEDWPGIAMDVAEYLVSKKAAAIGVDTLSPDSPQALRGKPIHPVILEKQILIVENLRNLDQLPDVFLFLALPLKIREGSGSPLRAVAMF
jgi:kynurenine formamidase